MTWAKTWIIRSSANLTSAVQQVQFEGIVIRAVELIYLIAIQKYLRVGSAYQLDTEIDQNTRQTLTISIGLDCH